LLFSLFLSLSLSLLTRLHDRLTGSMVSDLYHRLRRSRREGLPPAEAAEESMFFFEEVFSTTANGQAKEEK